VFIQDYECLFCDDKELVASSASPSLRQKCNNVCWPASHRTSSCFSAKHSPSLGDRVAGTMYKQGKGGRPEKTAKRRKLEKWCEEVVRRAGYRVTKSPIKLVRFVGAVVSWHGMTRSDSVLSCVFSCIRYYRHVASMVGYCSDRRTVTCRSF
jgi:hypothetical protein